jgi:hypothetical protein
MRACFFAKTASDAGEKFTSIGLCANRSAPKNSNVDNQRLTKIKTPDFGKKKDCFIRNLG